jgi:pyruvate dehydrogenase E2 component (dihydrolipoamide acetyltransferase)
MAEFRMPALGADMTEGKVLEWLVKPGDTVHRGDVVAVIDTAKAEIDAEIFEDGVIEELLVPVGERVPVGTPLARVQVSGAVEPVTPAAPPVIAASAGDGRLRVSPVARRMAEQLGVDLTALAGTGPHGAISKADVERAAGAAPAPPPGQPPPATPSADDRRASIRSTIAALMARSNREIPHYYVTDEIDMTRALAWMEAHNAERPIGERLVSAALLLTATARAARGFPDMNGFCVDGAHHPADHVHLGVAIALRGGGVIAPAILDADRKGPAEVMRDLRGLVARARGKGLRGSELSEPTLTVTSLGDQGVASVAGVIYPPQVALVGFGRVRERPWAEHGMVGARPVAIATLAADHRVSDGHRGALFLSTVNTLLQEPEKL